VTLSGVTLQRLPFMQVVLFDVQQRIVMGELSTPFVKYVIWSKDMSQVMIGLRQGCH
jgi:hypothetical protein